MLVQTRESDAICAAESRPLFKVVICGEVNAGKSTVMNALLRGRYLPDNIGQTARPVITARYRAEAGAEVHCADGNSQPVDAAKSRDQLRGASRVTLWSDIPQIAGLELVEVPLTTAEAVTDEDIELVRSADALIWVTIASQAWRLTEKAILGAFGDAMPDRSLIVVSRADKLRSKKDREKLRSRVERETMDQFDGCVFLHGSNRTIDASKTAEDKWTLSGGVEILEQLHGFAGTDMAQAEEPTPEPTPELPENLLDLDEFRPQSDEAKSAEVPDTPVDQPVVPIFESVRTVPMSGVPVHNVEAEATKDEPEAPPALHDPADTPRSVETSLARISRRLPDGSLVGLIAPEGSDKEDPITVLRGETSRCRNAAQALSDWIEHLRTAYILNGLDPQPDAIILTSAGARIACEYLPGHGTVFLVAEAEAVSLGAAKSLMIQMRCAAAITI